MADKKVDSMTVEELLAKAGTMYKVSKILGLSKVATYRWVKRGKIPPSRIKSLMLLKPEWFENEDIKPVQANN